MTRHNQDASVGAKQEAIVWPWMSTGEIAFRRAALSLVNEELGRGLIPADPGPYTGLGFLTHHNAEQSVVVKVNGRDASYVVKMSHRANDLPAEVAFLRRWKCMGVSVPEVLHVTKLSGQFPHDAIVFEFVPWPLLGDAMMADPARGLKCAFHVGETLGRMHEAIGSGFGKPVPPGMIKGQYASFEEETQRTVFDEAWPALIRDGVLDPTMESAVIRAFGILNDDLKSHPPVLIHGDLRPHNIFLKPDGRIIVFDPNSRITHPSTCVAVTMIRITIEHGALGRNMSRRILEGYRTIRELPDHVLHAGQVLRAVKLLYAWHWKRKVALRDKLRDYCRSLSDKV